ncbi:MAG TPA: Wall-associated protein precursor [Archangium sp.]|jgi:hypothetical protein|uniref:Wall-associated protein precursor n=1 Tax=Archangium sp. TaxID=1872627 RepID=UPI002EDA91C9
MLAILLLLLAQVPCAPNDLTVVCSCKQGVASACDTLRLIEPGLATKLEAAFQAAAAVEGAHIAVEALDAEDETSPASPEPPECKGQLHHIISRRIAKELARHETLSGQYKPRDRRFVSRAVDEKAHCGYGGWHRDVDDEVIAWLQSRPKATPKEFEAFLREIYRRPYMLKRFPRGF